MAKQRPSVQKRERELKKRDREQKKRDKAALKRERREGLSDGAAPALVPDTSDGGMDVPLNGMG